MKEDILHLLHAFDDKNSLTYFMTQTNCVCKCDLIWGKLDKRTIWTILIENVQLR